MVFEPCPANSTGVEESVETVPDETSRHHCLICLSRLIQKNHDSTGEGLNEIAGLIPAILGRRESFGARITFRNRTFMSGNFRSLPFKRNARILVSGSIAGEIEIVDLERESAGIPQPEQNEIGDKIDIIAKEIGTFIKYKELEEERIHLASIVKSSGDAIISISLDGGILNWNNGAAELFGYSRDEVLGQPLSILNPTFDSREIRQILDALSNGIYLRNHDTQWLDKSGKKIDVSITVSPIEDRNDECRSASIIARDISLRKAAEKSLKDSEQTVKAVLNAPDVSIFLVDTNGIILTINDAAAARMRKTAEQLPGRSIFDILPEELSVVRHSWFLKSLMLKIPVCFEDMRDGIFYDNCIYPIINEKAKVEKLAIFAKDITERKTSDIVLKEMNERLRTERMALEEKNSALQEILNKVDNEKNAVASQFQSNVDRIIMPILRLLEQRAGESEKIYITLLKNNLKDITSPFIRELETRHQKLTPRELEICNMIKSGYNSRKIAESACISVGAVKLHRNRIRKKLGLIKKKVNLTTYLQSR